MFNYQRNVKSIDNGYLFKFIKTVYRINYNQLTNYIRILLFYLIKYFHESFINLYSFIGFASV